MPRVYNRKKPHPEGAVPIDRSTPYGNPFRIGVDGSRDECIGKFERWLDTQPALVEKAKRELAGRDLLCHCAPKNCHGYVWLRIVNPRRPRK